MAVKRDNDTNKWYYYGSYRVGNETKQYKKRGFDRKQDAIKAEVLFKESLKNPGSKMTLNEMIDIYMEFSEKRIKESTYKNHIVMFKVWKNALGDKLLQKVTTKDIQDVLEELLSKNKFSSVHQYYLRIQAVMNYANKHQYITDNPCSRVDLKKNPNLHKEEMMYWTEEQFNKFIDNVDSTIFHLLFTNQFYMGTRIGDDDDKIRLNQRKPSKYKGLSRFGPEKNLQRINKFMKERPTFYKKLIQMKENFRFYLRCFYCITKVVILQFNSEKQDRISS